MDLDDDELKATREMNRTKNNKSMLSDEEKEAIIYFYNLRATIDESNMLFGEDINVKCGKEKIKKISSILNLIEKQSKEIVEKRSKEIEELKEKNKKLNLVRLQYLVSIYPDTTETYKKYKKELDELLKEE